MAARRQEKMPSSPPLHSLDTSWKGGGRRGRKTNCEAMSSSGRSKFRDITAYVDKNPDSLRFLRFLKENAAVDMAHQNMTKVLVQTNPRAADAYANCPPAVQGKPLPMLYCSIIQSYIPPQNVYDFVQAYPRIVREYEAKMIAQARPPAAPPAAARRHPSSSSAAASAPPPAPPSAVAAASGMAASGMIGIGGGGGSRAHARMSGGSGIDALFDQNIDDGAPINPKADQNNKLLESMYEKEMQDARREEEEYTSRMNLARHASR